MALPLIDNIAEKAASNIKALILENSERIQKDFHFLTENTPDGKKCVLRLKHTIVLDLDSSEQADVLTWSIPRRSEASSELSKTPSGERIGEETPDYPEADPE